MAALTRAERLVELLSKQLGDLSDRSVIGKVLTEATWVEQALGRYLEFKMPERSGKILSELYENNGPLSTFSSKIKIARAFGFIPAQLAAEMHKIRVIRNKFAHTDQHLTFEHEEISKLIAKLAVAQKMEDSGSTVFTSAVIAIGEELVKLVDDHMGTLVTNDH